MIFSGLEQVFAHHNTLLSYGVHLWRIGKGQGQLRRRHEFNRVFLTQSGDGCSMPHVFPLPPFVQNGRVMEYRMGTLDSDEEFGVAHGVNLIQAALNMLHGSLDVEFKFVSAAHSRIQARLGSGLKDMMMDFELMSLDEIRQFLKHNQHYTGGGIAIPLGSRGGVPTSAATVNLSEELEKDFPLYAEQVREPKLLLLPSRLRPIRIKRGHTWVNSSYPDLVRKNVKAGLHVLKKEKQVAKHRGSLCLAGAFAVPKDETEDRVITDPSVNQLLDPQKLPRPRFAYIPKLRVTLVPRTGRLLVSKRDARHYFHSLRIGRKWQRWLCGPPIADFGRGLRYPASCTAPMGFGPSAGWAQALTDVATNQADLPSDCRLHPDAFAPTSLPIWGSICDDIWALEHTEAETKAAFCGPTWLSRAEQAWVDRGVHPNHKKAIDASPGEELQGYYVDPDLHWVGVSLTKRRALFQAVWHVLTSPSVVVGDIERLVGKFGFVHSSRPVMRSIFVEVYGWLDDLRGRKVRVTTLPDVIWCELMTAALLLPYAQFNLSAPFSQRVECSDASMSGIGRAWATMPSDLVQRMAQLCDHPGTYTNLNLPFGLALNEEDKCPLRKLKLPRNLFHWHTAGARWRPLYIFLGEADAAVWVAECRLRRACDDEHRFVHPLDSASCVGAFMKGRSSSRLLNHRCQKLCAIGIAGGHETFYPWIPSGDNPADKPSRLFEGERKGHSESPVQPEAFEEVFLDPFGLSRTLPSWSGNERFFLHLCSGTRRDDDLVSWVERLSQEHGLHIYGLRVDPLSPMSQRDLGFTCNDLLDGHSMLHILQLVQSGRVAGLFVSPPCSTFSAVRHKPLHRQSGAQVGPRPLRARSNPWSCLPNRTSRENHSVDIGTALAFICIGMLGEARIFGAWVGGEHPADRGCEPYPSIFCSTEIQQLCSIVRLCIYVIDQCMFGAKTRKPTGLVLPYGNDEFVRTCNHTQGHTQLFGWDSAGQCFRTTAATAYPSGLSQALASLFVTRILASKSHGYEQPYAPMQVHSDSFGRDPWFSQQRTAWTWPAPSRSFLAEVIARCHQRKIPTSNSAPQS